MLYIRYINILKTKRTLVGGKQITYKICRQGNDCNS